MKTGALEYWSDGVMVKREGSDSSSGFAVLQYSNTPLLHFVYIPMAVDYKKIGNSNELEE